MRKWKKFIILINLIYNKAILLRQHVKYDKGLVINGRIKIFSAGNVELGIGVRINSGKNYNLIGGDTQSNLIIQNGAKLYIGNYSGISNTTIVAAKCVWIGNYVKIGGSCKIYDSDFHSLKYEERIMNPDPGIKTKSVYIKDGAFIGAHSIVLKGVTIGRNSIVGAGSIVTKSIPDGEIWAGNPAHFLRKIENNYN